MKNENIPSNIRAAARLAAAVIKRMKEKRDTCLISAAGVKTLGSVTKIPMPLYSPSDTTSADRPAG